MTKQLTPLEALEILKEANTIYCGCASNLFARYRFEIETIETVLKALEIIKEKCQFFIVEDETPYNGGYRVWDSEYYQFNELTKEEFDLLKEVLK